MLDNEKRKYIQKALNQRKINKRQDVRGERFSISCKDHDIDIVYYAAAKEKAPLILGFHGGGFLFGGNAMNNQMWYAVSETLGVHVASVEYRKSPEYRYREALEDAMAAYFWFREHGEERNADSENISVMGFSAGANLAASLCLMLNMQGFCEVKNQILVYPYLDAYTDPAEKGENNPLMYLFNELHSTQEEARSSLLSPIYAKKQNLQGLPETWLCMAEHDTLKPEGYAYGERLKQSAVPVHTMCAEQMPHEYFEAAFGDYTEAVLREKTPELYKAVKTKEALKASKMVLEFLKPAFGE